MGQLIEGVWKTDWYDTSKSGGKFVRASASFRNWITAGGSAGPSGVGGFKAESGRYHLYVSYACPWAHRTLIFRALKELEDHITVNVVHPDMLDNGWTFASDFPGATGDTLFGKEFAYQIYKETNPTVSGRVTVPILWDKQTHQIVSNESSEIIRMFNTAFNDITGNTLDYYPENLRAEIDDINARVYDSFNNGVYKCGFATTQSAYDEAVAELFETLDWLEERLSTKRYLTGNQVTEADWRLFPTLLRFDTVYHIHFKCSRNRIADMPNLFGYARELYQMPGIAATVKQDHITRHYFYSHETINPNRIVPMRSRFDLSAPHNRDHIK